MEEMKEIFNSILQNKIIDSLLVIIINILIYRIIHKIILDTEKRVGPKDVVSKRGRTYFKLIISTLRYVIIIITVLVILQLNGVDVSSLLAGVGILSVIVGLAVQDALKDVIRGMSILSDRYFAVGDIVKYNDIEAKVLVIGLKSTKIQDIKNGNIISIANRNIEQIEIVSNLNYISIPMPYEVSVEKAEKAVDDIIKSVKTNNNVIDCKYKSVNELADSSINYYIEVHCKPDYKLQVRRDALRTILIELENNGISVPYTQIDVHNK